MKKFNIVVVFAVILLSSCSTIDKNISGDFYKISYIRENYDRDDLLLIMYIGSSEGEVYCTWKISAEELEKQEKFTLYELVNNIDTVRLINNSTYFINNYFEKRYTNKMYFHSIEYITVNNKRFGDKTNIKRNDWVIVLSYKKYDDVFNEKIFILPDYRIIISSNNFENVILDKKELKE